MIKCKGCEGDVEYVLIEDLRGTPMYSHAGPAIKHIPETPCQWFIETPATQILAYINVASYKTRANERQIPLPDLASK